MPLVSSLITPVPCILGSQPQAPALSDTSLEAGLVAYLSSRVTVPGGWWPLYIDRSTPPGTWPAVVYSVSEVEHVETLAGSGGMATATVEIDCYSNFYPDVVQLAEAIRKSLHGFSGWMGCVGVWGVWPQSQEDEIEQPQDNSGTWWFSRQLTYNVQFYEARPTF